MRYVKWVMFPTWQICVNRAYCFGFGGGACGRTSMKRGSQCQSDIVQETSWRAMATMENWSREEFRSVIRILCVIFFSNRNSQVNDKGVWWTTMEYWSSRPGTTYAPTCSEIVLKNKIQWNKSNLQAKISVVMAPPLIYVLRNLTYWTAFLNCRCAKKILA
jgi:hypothetical protein